MIADSGGTTAEHETPDFKMYGLTLDGNLAGNPTARRWETSGLLRIWSDYAVIRDNKFLNAMADAIEFSGSGAIIDGNAIVSSFGNAIHLGETYGTRISNNYIYDFMTGGEANGHSDGAIIASNAVYDTVITGNYVEKGNGYPAIGSWDATDLGVTITGNYFKDVGGGVDYGGGHRGGIEVVAPNGTAQSRIAISGNVVVNGAFIKLDGSTSPWSATNGIAPIAITGNYFESTGIQIDTVNGASVTGNAFYKAPPTGFVNNLASDSWVYVTTYSKNVTISGNSFTAPETLTTTRYTIYCAGVSAPRIDGNTFEGMGVAVYLYNGGTVWTSNARVNGNTFRNQGYVAANLGAAPNVYYGNSFTNNAIVQEAGFLTSTYAVRLSRGSFATGNTFDMAATAMGFYFAPSAADAATPGPIITNNLIRVAAGQSAVRLDTNARNAIVKGNYSNGGLWFNAGSEASNVLTDNTTIL
jgi:hypothetical protein